jgi:hypothetical protein
MEQRDLTLQLARLFWAIILLAAMAGLHLAYELAWDFVSFSMR